MDQGVKNVLEKETFDHSRKEKVSVFTYSAMKTGIFPSHFVYYSSITVF